jgi:hypothetical protein
MNVEKIVRGRGFEGRGMGAGVTHTQKFGLAVLTFRFLCCACRFYFLLILFAVCGGQMSKKKIMKEPTQQTKKLIGKQKKNKTFFLFLGLLCRWLWLLFV